MSKRFSELKFEEWIEHSLLQEGYNDSFTHSNELSSKYDKEYCLIPETLLEFIKTTQKEEYEKLEVNSGGNPDSQILKRVSEQISSKGIVDVLREGIQTKGSKFELVYFQPKSSLNQDHLNLYQQNHFTIVRQLHYSIKNNNSLDMVIFINGIPIVTMELKNQLTGQNIKDSEYQYKKDRDPKEPLFKFKRCLVHFCVDNDEVKMTTRLSGFDTKFLPYNKDIPNPIVSEDYRTSYLWKEVLQRDSLLDIIDNFVLVSEETDKEWNEERRMVTQKTFETLIFPRYHQLEVIRNLKSTIKEEGVGNNYLIQHTTGSGKSYSIGWLSHTLTSLYRKDGDTKRMFDTILVLTDRKVLDKQLQRTVSSLERTDGVVNKVDVNSQQLKEYLERGKDIIITTVQKFPHISETISELKNKTFGVIIDEVHSSQSGETSKHLKKSLSKHLIEEDEEGNIDFEELIRRDIESRGKQPHISFFGFTGTPKNKTLELFGRRNKNNEFVPFHTYTMKQSILEGFTLDVLQNYTTYKRYFKVLQSGEEDKELPEGKVKRELVNFVDSHSETIRQKVSIILEHFVNITSKKINGRGRGMVVVRSRKHCVLFHEEMKKQMREMNLPFSCLVGFSGSINHNGKENTETSLNIENGLGQGVSIPDGLKDPRYRILIVSNKFQTGFDEPLIHSMYVDKKLNGVQCVQTLSRLNRTKKGKTDTFVMDFVNDTEDIVTSFQPYFTSTKLVGETDPDKLYDMLDDIKGYQLFTKYQVDEFCKVFFDPKEEGDHKIHPIIDVVVNQYIEKLDDDQKEEYKSKVQSFIRLYTYISQISPFTEVDWEKHFVFLRFLNKKLPKGVVVKVDIIDSVDLDSLRIQKIGESKLSLEDKQGEVDGIGSGPGGKGEEEKELLSQIIEKINTIYGIDLKKEDSLTIETIKNRVNQDQDVIKVVKGNNSEDVKREFYLKKFQNDVIDYHGDRLEFYKKVMSPEILPLLVNSFYEELRRNI
jgi:type I restriction enzyme, R subunit